MHRLKTTLSSLKATGSLAAMYYRYRLRRLSTAIVLATKEPDRLKKMLVHISFMCTQVLCS